ncbi:phage tail tape measure protein [Vibrio sp. 10N.286.48.B7]|uniref:phage tail tape measure protein n=1 Tax=Vibrio sp. 10N.286.48.B7 TaxID=1880853 RepID=UPI000C82C48E|nr:phage tail tape measure protein [Vibrio sp. 10N.286.48.B7]PMH78709.1 phage tail tape measure protein [Vibrio sp. 10N.286.48.B7]
MLPEALRFQVGLIDQISKPLGNIQRQMTDVTNTYRQGTHTMMAGAAGMVGAGFALQQALMPAIEMDRALGEVKSLGVADEQLKQLSDTALEFAVDYGKSASDFVAASYDIQSAISGLGGNELSEFTRASGVLAAATKADTSTITNYVGTMYGIFQNSANEMGKADWVNMLGGQTAKAVQMFKTTGDGMSSAFTSVGAAATSVGVGMTEQMAILGTLQSTMSGSEAGTKYRAFLAGTAKAQEALNMQFTNAQGQMLPMVDILNQIKGRYGETISVAEAAELSKAFGTQEATAMIQLLMQNTDGLATSINELGKVKGLDVAEQMAGAMTDQWERLEQGVFAISAAFGAVLLPAILPVVGGMAEGATAIVQWTQMFPNLTKYIGFAAIAILGAAAAGGAFTLMMGVGKQAMATYMLTMKMFTGVSFLLTKGMAALRVAVLAANIAIAANPIILVVGAVVAAIAAVGALIYYWGDLKASFGDTTWFQVLEGAITLISTPFKAMFEFVKAGWQWVMSGFTDTSGFAFIGQMVSWLKGGFESLVLGWHMFTAEMADTWWFTAISSAVELVTLPFQTLFNFLSAGWQWVMSGFTDTSGFAFIGQMADSMRNIFGSVFSWFTDKLAGIWETMKGLIDWIPGFGSDDETAPVQSESVKRATPQAQIQPGGAAKSIASYQTSSTNYGGVAIYPTYMNSPQDMASELEMAAG